MSGSEEHPFRCIQPNLKPLPTGVTPDLKPLAGIKAVIFDVYGTLVISGSGDVGSADANRHEIALGESLSACGLPTITDLGGGTRRFREIIDSQHAVSRGKGIDAPEVDIVGVWRTWLASYGFVHDVATAVHLAVAFEARANPSCVMPGARAVIQELRNREIQLGFVSNAQFFTLELLEISLEQSPLTLGFNPDLSFFSYRYRMAKPGHDLFAALVVNLRREGIEPSEALYVGNDMLNDVWAAGESGLNTALFAGDKRSLRMREDDERVENTKPDLVVDALSQLTSTIS